MSHHEQDHLPTGPDRVNSPLPELPSDLQDLPIGQAQNLMRMYFRFQSDPDAAAGSQTMKKLESVRRAVAAGQFTDFPKGSRVRHRPGWGQRIGQRLQRPPNL